MFVNWSIIALQYCVSFCCPRTRISCLYTCIPFVSFPPHPPASPYSCRSLQSSELSSLRYGSTPLAICFISQWQCRWEVPVPGCPFLPFPVSTCRSLVLCVCSCSANSVLCTIFVFHIYVLTYDTRFSFWLHSVGQSGPSTALQMTQFHSFLYPNSILLYICTASESIHQRWTSRLLPCPVCCKQCWIEHWVACVLMN